MTVEELTEKARENKRKAVETAKEEFKELLKSLYANCEEAIKEDRESPLFAYPDNCTAFDLFVDNLAEIIQDTEKFSEIDFIKASKGLHKAENTDIKEYFY